MLSQRNRWQLKKVIRDEDGVTAIEYVVIISLISVAISAAMPLLGGQIGGTFAEISTQLHSVSQSSDLVLASSSSDQESDDDHDDDHEDDHDGESSDSEH